MHCSCTMHVWSTSVLQCRSSMRSNSQASLLGCRLGSTCQFAGASTGWNCNLTACGYNHCGSTACESTNTQIGMWVRKYTKNSMSSTRAMILILLADDWSCDHMTTPPKFRHFRLKYVSLLVPISSFAECMNAVLKMPAAGLLCM